MNKQHIALTVTESVYEYLNQFSLVEDEAYDRGKDSILRVERENAERDFEEKKILSAIKSYDDYNGSFIQQESGEHDSPQGSFIDTDHPDYELSHHDICIRDHGF